MSSIDDEKMIQAFFPDSADPAFGEGVCIGSPDRSVDDSKPSDSKPASNAWQKLPSLSWIKNRKGFSLSESSQTRCLAC